MCPIIVESLYPFPPQLSHPVIGQSCRLVTAIQVRDRWGGWLELWFELSFACAEAGPGSGPGVSVQNMGMALIARACRWFLRLCVAWLSLEVILLHPRFFRLRAVVFGVGFGFNLRLQWGSSIIPSSLAENVGLSRLSLIRVSMKKFFFGRG